MLIFEDEGVNIGGGVRGCFGKLRMYLLVSEVIYIFDNCPRSEFSLKILGFSYLERNLKISAKNDFRTIFDQKINLIYYLMHIDQYYIGGSSSCKSELRLFITFIHQAFGVPSHPIPSSLHII